MNTPEKISIEEIHIQRQLWFRRAGTYPDNVMIHPCHKSELGSEAHCLLNSVNNFKTCFGMKIIWTDAVVENEIILTVNCK